ncbi:MAG: cytochrome c oxidase subunit II [Thermoanaerobaculia bacterium]|nr:cytochrome c oxidase subunit II [Thermoanaerobaculia bacterium]
MSLGFPLFPESASTTSGQVDALYLFLVAVSAFFSLLIAASVIYCAVRYRRREPDQVGSTFHANLLMEVTWTIIPLIIVLGVFFWGARVFFVQRATPDDALEITGIAKQWMWKFQHPDGRREINELHVPVGQPVEIRLISQDVIHDLFLPAFRTKTDVLPGRYTTLWFEATKPGTYHLFCAEYCGAEHSRMTGQVVVMEPAAYEDWLAGGAQPTVPPAEAGAQLFTELTCDTCHIEGEGGRGPSLHGLYGTEEELADGSTVVVDDSYLREAILTPAETIVAGYQPIMPTYKGQISEANVLKLIAYIRSLGTPQPTQGPSPAVELPSEDRPQDSPPGDEGPPEASSEETP